MYPLVFLVCIVYYVIVTCIVHAMTGLGYWMSLLLTFIIHIVFQLYIFKDEF